MNKKDLKELHLTPLEDLIAEDYGESGTQERAQFDKECDEFITRERLKEERLNKQKD